MKTEALERKADEELRMNEKVKEFSQHYRQFNDAVTHEKENLFR